MFSSNLEPESVVLLDDGLFCLSEQCFWIISIAEDGGSGICTKLAWNRERYTAEH